jgi:hypothetical protein
LFFLKNRNEAHVFSNLIRIVIAKDSLLKIFVDMTFFISFAIVM